MKISDPNPSPPPPPPPDTYNIAQIVCYTQNANEHSQEQDHHYPCLVSVITKHKWHFHKFTSGFLGTKIIAY